jgi:CheY-like chemotaxis protein
MKTLPLFFYPSTTLLVDDNTLFLKSLNFLFGDDASTMLFTSPQQTLQFFNNYESFLCKTNFIRGAIESDNYDMLNHMPVDFEFSSLQKLRNRIERHSDVAVMITDYNMPEMNGIELCRELRHLPIKKILLTGEAELSLAVAAFNEGAIDCFIRKGTEKIDNEIIFYVKKLSQQFFVEATKSLLDHLETDYVLPFSDPIFISFFNEWCTVNSIKEYYLVDKNGNLLVIDEQNKHYYFTIHTERTLNNLVGLHSDDAEALIYLRAIILREKTPFFGEGIASWDQPPHRWAESFYSPQILQGREKYYWALVPKNMLNIEGV